jgi:hypothetical protein
VEIIFELYELGLEDMFWEDDFEKLTIYSNRLESLEKLDGNPRDREQGNPPPG